jgi:hypothetical protein
LGGFWRDEMKKYIFKQYVIEYTAVDAENEEAAFEEFYSGGIDPFRAEYNEVNVAVEAA